LTSERRILTRASSNAVAAIIKPGLHRICRYRTYKVLKHTGCAAAIRKARLNIVSHTYAFTQPRSLKITLVEAMQAQLRDRVSWMKNFAGANLQVKITAADELF
jgi:hypothetical protein